MPTWNEIQAMSDTEVKELNKKLTKKLVTRVAITIGATVAFHLAVNYIAKKIETA